MTCSIVSDGKGYSCSTRQTAMSVAAARRSEQSTSTYTLPLHSTSRLISFDRDFVSRSSMTGRKRPSASSSGVDATAGCRSRLLGVRTNSGRGSSSSSSGLPPKHVKVLRRRAAVDKAQVDVGGRLKDALGARARMIGPLPFVTVRQQEDERRRQSPFRAAGRDEFIENDLRAVEESRRTVPPRSPGSRVRRRCSRTRTR